MSKTTFFYLLIPRYKCKSRGKTFLQSQNYSPKRSRLSHETIYLILKKLQKYNQTFVSVAKLFHLSTTTIQNVFDSYINPPRETFPLVMSIDEAYNKKQFSFPYSVILFDFFQHKIIDVIQDRKKSDSNPPCSRLKKFPFTCNGCEKKQYCRLNKYEYNPRNANDDYNTRLVESRNHIHLSDQDLEKIDRIVSPLIQKNISPEVILHIHPELNISIATLYKLIDVNLLSVKNIDLKRKVRRRIRKPSHIEVKIEQPICKTGRLYDDFLSCISLYPHLDIWEMDIVEGKKGGKALMTLLHRKSNLMLIFLIHSICKKEIVRIFNFIKSNLDDSLFSQTFPLFLRITEKSSLILEALKIHFLPLNV